MIQSAGVGSVVRAAHERAWAGGGRCSMHALALKSHTHACMLALAATRTHPFGVGFVTPATAGVVAADTVVLLSEMQWRRRAEQAGQGRARQSRRGKGGAGAAPRTSRAGRLRLRQAMQHGAECWRTRPCVRVSRTDGDVDDDGRHPVEKGTGVQRQQQRVLQPASRQDVRGHLCTHTNAARPAVLTPRMHARVARMRPLVLHAAALASVVNVWALHCRTRWCGLSRSKAQ